ncbi:MAG: VanZ family protein [Bacilli bacterium]
MFQNTIENILFAVTPLLIIVSVAVISIRIAYIIKFHNKIVIYKEIYNYLFVLYILVLFNAVSFQDKSLIGTSNFIPFREIFRYDIFNDLFFKNVIGNVILMVPYTVYISLFLKPKNILLSLFMVLILSCSIELTQLYISGRVFDLDDIILNCIGGIIGYYVYHLIVILRNKFPKISNNDLFLNIVSIIFLIGTILYIVNFWR